jgi:hypothetical protein
LTQLRPTIAEFVQEGKQIERVAGRVSAGFGLPAKTQLQFAAEVSTISGQADL